MVAYLIKLIKQSFSFIISYSNMKKVLCFLSVNPEYVQFAIPELKAMLHFSGIPLDILLSEELQGQEIKHYYEINHQLFKHFPFVVITVPDFEKHRQYFERACKESVMIYKMILLISEGPNYNQLLSKGDEEILSKLCRNQQQLVVCDFNSRNRVIDRKEQIVKIHSALESFNIKGQVSFKSPNIRYQLVECHEWYQLHHLKSSDETLKHVYFGIQLCSNHIATAKFNNAYQLNKRIYLGPTSTDNDLAFLMCNQALVEPGSVVIDPFVGTGGLLIPPASKGAITFGSDLDIRVLNGYAVGRINKKSPFFNPAKKLELFTPKITLNFEQYGLPLPNIIRIDSTKLTLRACDIFDAIITDPPYGLRAMSRTVTRKAEVQSELKSENAVEESAELTKKQERQEEDIESNEDIQSNSEDQKFDKKGQTDPKELQMTEAQIKNRQFKRQRRRIKRENKRKRKQLMSEEEKQFKEALKNKMNRQRVEQWEKFDKGKIETTEREKIFNGLLAFGKKYLKRQGRLVFLYPIYEDQKYQGALSLPKHEGFELIDLSENKMSKGNSRILVTLQKI